MGFLEIILVTLGAVDFVVWGLCAHALTPQVRRGWRWMMHGFFLLQIVFVVAVYRGHAGSVFSSLPVPLLAAFYIWHLLVAPVLLVIGLMGLLGEAAIAIYRFFGPKPEILYTRSEGFSRREFLGTLAAIAPPLLTFSLSAAAMQQLSLFRVRRLTVTLPTLPQGLDGMTIALLSDLHIGQFTQGKVLQEIIDETNRLQPDLTVFAGDLINSDLDLLPQAIEAMKAIRSPLVLCEGNHDVAANRGKFQRTLKAEGLCLLLGEAVTLPIRGLPVQIFGIEWDGPRNWQDRGQERNLAASVEEVLQKRDPEAFHILLAHHPHAWDYCGEVPLTLSGHTHGGQLMLTSELGFGPWMFRYWTGLYERKSPSGNPQALVVSNGVGNWFPIRTAAPAEIVHLTLRRG